MAENQVEEKKEEKVVSPKNPRFIAMRDELLAEKAKIMETVGPAREEFEKLTQNPRINELRKIIVDNKPRLFEIDNELAAIARALGARGMKIEPGEFKKE